MDSEADVKGLLWSGRADKESEVYYEVNEVTASRTTPYWNAAYALVPSQENPKHEFRNTKQKGKKCEIRISQQQGKYRKDKFKTIRANSRRINTKSV